VDKEQYTYTYEELSSEARETALQWQFDNERGGQLSDVIRDMLNWKEDAPGHIPMGTSVDDVITKISETILYYAGEEYLADCESDSRGTSRFFENGVFSHFH